MMGICIKKTKNLKLSLYVPLGHVERPLAERDDSLGNTINGGKKTPF